MSRGNLVSPGRVRTALVFLLLANVVFLQHAYAGCTWLAPGVSSSNSSVDMIMTAFSRDLIAKKRWVEYKQLPVSALMGVFTAELDAGHCSGGLVDLVRRRVDAVLVPPANATLEGGYSYMLPSTATGVGMRVEVLNATGMHRDGFLLGTTPGPTNSGGSVRDFPLAIVRFSWVKTGGFAPSPLRDNDIAHQMWVPDALGYIRYYAAGDASERSATENRFVLDKLMENGLVATGSAIAFNCTLKSIGEVSFDTGIADKLIVLPAINNKDFSGIGAVDSNAGAKNFKFFCNGTTHAKLRIYFDATFPFNGAAGVGMPTANSDIGVQVLANGTPVTFGRDVSTLLGWGVTPAALPARGAYCLANCGNDTSNANWFDGGAANIESIDGRSNITFNYYQTTKRRPYPKSFDVPFTVTVDWD